jgi:hypothetical protein
VTASCGPVCFINGRSCEINYSRHGGLFNDELVKAFLSTTAPGAVWTPQLPQIVGRETWTTGKAGTSSFIWASIFKESLCWLEFVDFRSKNGFGGYVTGKAVVFLVLGPGGQETILYVLIME